MFWIFQLTVFNSRYLLLQVTLRNLRFSSTHHQRKSHAFCKITSLYFNFDWHNTFQYLPVSCQSPSRDNDNLDELKAAVAFRAALTESLRNSAPNWFLTPSAGVALSSTGAAHPAIYLPVILSEAHTIRPPSPSHYQLDETSRTLHLLRNLILDRK